MKVFWCFLLLFLIRVPYLFANDGDKFNKRFEKAEKLFKEGNFSDALHVYADLYNADTTNFNICYKVGVCYLKAGKGNDIAIHYLERASRVTTLNCEEGSLKERNAPLLTYKLLGEAYHLNAEYDLAIAAYKKFKKIFRANNRNGYELIKEVTRKIEMCNLAKKLMASPLPVKIENMGENINSPYPDYSTVFTVDQSTMIFTSRRPANVGGKTYDSGKYFEDIYISTKTDAGWSKATNIGPPINTEENEASVCISADGQEILIYKDHMGDGNIYSTSLKGNLWTTPVKLNAHINSKSWEPSAFISANGNTLYFTSDRPGGFGGRDIYKSEKTPAGDWGRAVNLGSSINSPYDEDAPFLHPDGVTLFFSSKGHKTIGGFDVFQSNLLPNGKWSEPVNVGYPINSPSDDVYYVVSTDKKKAYFTSVRDGGYGEKDIYEITFIPVKNEIKPAAPELTLFKGRVLDEENLTPIEAFIEIVDNEKHTVISTCNSNSSSGKFLISLPAGKNYGIAVKAKNYLFYSDNFNLADTAQYREVEKNVLLKKPVAGKKIIMKNIFYDFDKATLGPESTLELDRLVALLKDNSSMKIELSSHTDSKGTDEYNDKLSQARAQSVVDYIIAKGIAKDRLTAKGYGESQPIENNETEEGRHMNRRTELKILSK